MTKLTSAQIEKVEQLVDKHILVNANWVLDAVRFVYNLSAADAEDDNKNPTPFSYSDAEEFFNYCEIDEDTGEPVNKDSDDYTPVEFPQCWIVSEYLGRQLKAEGELVITGNRKSGSFWFCKTWGTPFADQSLFHRAFENLL